MATDYEKFYQGSRHALGDPTKEFVAFFETFDTTNAQVLDIGCGQGRDALHIARLGHRVTGIDISATGIAQLLEDASNECLNVEAFVSDLRSFEPAKRYDVIVIDRTLHMLGDPERAPALRRLLPCTEPHSSVLIADERSNIASFERVFAESEFAWSPILKKRGYLFVRRTS